MNEKQLQEKIAEHRKRSKLLPDETERVLAVYEKYTRICMGQKSIPSGWYSEHKPFQLSIKKKVSDYQGPHRGATFICPICAQVMPGPNHGEMFTCGQCGQSMVARGNSLYLEAYLWDNVKEAFGSLVLMLKK